MSDGKMSKSKGNVIYADDLVRLFGVDAVRYFVLHEIPFANDGIISYELIIERINAELANILGNLVNRTITMSHKYFGGVVKHGKAEALDSELIELALKTPALVEKHMDSMHIADAIDDVFALLKRANKYIDETEPWVLGREGGDKERLSEVMYNLVESIRFAAVLLEPFMPDTSKAIHEQLKLENGGLESLCEFGKVENGHVLSENSILFARIDAAKKLAEIEEENKAKAEADRPKKPEEPEISIDDFAKVSFRAAKVLECEPLKKSDKLLVLKVDNGFEIKQVLSGIAQHYKPEQLIGKTVVLVDNLAPAKLRGEMSEGMLLAADTENGPKVMFLDDDIKAGAVIR
jgi:methionyl-tRNA synthetase